MPTSISVRDNNDKRTGNNSKNLLQRLSFSWSKRAQVRHCNVHNESTFDLTKPDFLESLLPFRGLGEYQDLTQEDKFKLLTAGWLVYNTKTIDIEKEIIIPLCNRIIEGKFSGLKNSESKRVASETLVDESYHIMLCVISNDITKNNRSIDIELKQANVVTSMKHAIAACEYEWQKDIIMLVTAFVSETIISDYLALLSKSQTVQPLHREVVHAHKLDEGVHRYVFVELIKCFLRASSAEQRRYVFDVIPKSIEWFQCPSIDAWLQLLDFYKIPDFNSTSAALTACIAEHKEPVNGQKVLELVPALHAGPLLAYSI